MKADSNKTAAVEGQGTPPLRRRPRARPVWDVQRSTKARSMT